MKRTIVVLLVFALAIGGVVSADCHVGKNEDNLAVKTKLSTDIAPVDPLVNYNVQPAVQNNERFYRSAYITVRVTSPCDAQWRNKYPNNWMWQADRAIERADNVLTQRYGIDYYSVSQVVWDSNNTSASGLLNEAISEHGLNGADLMIAFTGRHLSGGTMGIARVGQPYCLIKDDGYAYNAETVQHETGHCYGLRHRSNDDDCIMTARGMGHLDQICSYHHQQWHRAKNKY